MTVIKTLSMAADNATSDLPYVDSTNTLNGSCSPLKHFFCVHGFEEIGGLYYLADAISSGKLVDNSTTYITPPSAGDTSINIDTGGNTVGFAAAIGDGADSLYDFTSEDVLLMLVGQPAVDSNRLRVMIGDTGGTGELLRIIGNESVAGTHTASDAINSMSHSVTAAVSAATDYGIYGKFDFDTSLTGEVLNYTTGSKTAVETISSGAPAPGAVAITYANIKGDNAWTIEAEPLYGLAMFSFSSGFPDNVDEMTLWMMNEWKNGNFVFPKEWDGL